MTVNATCVRRDRYALEPKKKAVMEFKSPMIFYCFNQPFLPRNAANVSLNSFGFSIIKK